MNENVDQFLIKSGIEFKKNFTLSKLSYVRTGGISRRFIELDNINDLKKLLNYFQTEDINFQIFGNYSNVVIRDGFIETPILKLMFKRLEIEQNSIYASSDILIPKLSKILSKMGISGFSKLYGIPGTVGGGIYMNAECYEQHLTDNLSNVFCIDDKGNELVLSKEQLDLKWRSSAFHTKFRHLIIVGASFTINRSSAELQMKIFNKYDEERKKYQETKYPNLGSVFKTKDLYKDISSKFIVYKLGIYLIRIYVKLFTKYRHAAFSKLARSFTLWYFRIEKNHKVFFSDYTINTVCNLGGNSIDIIEFINDFQKKIDYSQELEIEVYDQIK